MKVIIISLLFTLTLGVSEVSNAQISENALKGYVTGLKSENSGLVESSLMEMAKIKVKFPALKSTEFETELKSRIVSEKDIMVRYKLVLTMYILENPSILKSDEIGNMNEPNQFFYLAGSKVNGLLAGL